jgi:hypothetical protein
MMRFPRTHQAELEVLLTSMLDLHCSVDAFWQRFEALWERELLWSGRHQRRRATRLYAAEILTILILFQQSGYRTFKGYYP